MMTDPFSKASISMVYSDIGETLAIARFIEDRLFLDVFDFVGQTLKSLRDRGALLAIISNTVDLFASMLAYCVVSV
jgi:hypothetical protein